MDRPYKSVDPVTNKAYVASARGGFYVTITPDDVGENANRFYRRCLSQGRDADQRTIRNFLKPAFESAFQAKIQEYINMQGKPISNFVGLAGDAMVRASEELYPITKDIFADFGLAIDQNSARSLLAELNLECYK